MIRHVVVRAAWDAEADVWYVTHSDVAGLATEADTLDGLRAKLPGMVQDLLAEQAAQIERVELDLIAHVHDQIPLAA